MSVDPFLKALELIESVNKNKRLDYATQEDVFVNFRTTSAFAGFERSWLAALFNCQQKLSRITTLRAQGKLEAPTNESVYDTLLDNAVYSVIAFAMYLEEAESSATSVKVAYPDSLVQNTIKPKWLVDPE